MANDEHVALLKQGLDVWNAWREENPKVRPDLTGMDLTKANLYGANFFKANLSGAELAGADLATATLFKADLSVAHLAGANLSGAELNTAHLGGADLTKAALERALLDSADLSGADLSGASLREADLIESHLVGADLTKADLTDARLRGADLTDARLRGADLTDARLIDADLMRADLSGANLAGANLAGASLEGADLTKANLYGAQLRAANLSGADLSGAQLQGASLVDADLTCADLTGCRIYGVSAWRLNLERTRQYNLVITPADEPAVTVDNIEVAQFVYLLLSNQKLRDVIDTVTSKAVLILGRFTAERKAVLDALRDELRKRNYLPILFDFDVPATRDITETVSLLARMARFIIADLTDPSSIPKELEAVVPGLAVPVQPLLLGDSSRPYAMFKDYWKYDWVLPVYRYEGLEQLLAAIADKVIAPAEGKVKALQERRRMIEAELTNPR